MNGYDLVCESTDIHPLDMRASNKQLDIKVPVDNYHRKVLLKLHGILEDIKSVSEKDFKGQDDLKRISEGIIKDPNVELIIQRFETDKLRPGYCAECIFSKLKGV